MAVLYLEYSIVDPDNRSVVASGFVNELDAYTWIEKEGDYNTEYVIEKTVVKKEY